MKSILQKLQDKIHIRSLRSYTTFMITGIIALALTLSGAFFCIQTSRTLRDAYQEQMLQQLDNTMNRINEQVDLIDSLYPLFMSNNLIYDSLEAGLTDSHSVIAVERQMTYLLITNYVWKEKFINSVSIYTGDAVYRVSTVNSPQADARSREVYERADKRKPSLQLMTAPGGHDALYFVRNIFSSSTGSPIATMVISIDGPAYIDYLGSSLDNGWFICLYNEELELFSAPGKSYPIDKRSYLSVSEKLHNPDLSAVVVAPRQELMQRLSASLRTYLIVMLTIIILVMLISFALSKAITYPVTRMIGYVNHISEGHYEETIPPAKLYEEFNSLTNAFNHMLNEINAYHADNLESSFF
ncbi:MAG: hypothetical protein J6C33_00655 [Lachnospiraceae bacterium]|nr:hypothetical protein [Lachnospiraceae bacterium]